MLADAFPCGGWAGAVVRAVLALVHTVRTPSIWLTVWKASMEFITVKEIVLIPELFTGMTEKCYDVSWSKLLVNYYMWRASARDSICVDSRFYTEIKSNLHVYPEDLSWKRRKNIILEIFRIYNSNRMKLAIILRWIARNTFWAARPCFPVGAYGYTGNLFHLVPWTAHCHLCCALFSLWKSNKNTKLPITRYRNLKKHFTSFYLHQFSKSGYIVMNFKNKKFLFGFLFTRTAYFHINFILG